VFVVVIFNPLMPRNIADRSQRGRSDLAGAFGDFIRDRKDFAGLLIERRW
jgi:hypothetical protein